ncbi:hypothetical protein C0J52_11912 [Blattella germanica]|nr:hypothetical protein C0J52_11912 [Blattella germanica]
MTFVLRQLPFLVRGVAKGSQSIFFPKLHKNIYPNVYVDANLNHSLRKLSFRTNLQDEEEQDIYSEHDPAAETATNRKKAISNMQTIFDISEKRADSMVRKCPELKFVSIKSAQSTVKFLNDKGVSLATIKEYPWLLTYKLESLSSKLAILKKMGLGDLNPILPLLQMKLYRLKEYSKTEEKESETIPHGNRIKYTSEKLKCGLAEACKMFVEYEFLYSIPFQRYSEIMEALLDAGISPSHILRDLWIFRYNMPIIKNRLAILKEVGIKPIKPWMLRSTPDTFAISKYPSILRIHVSKLKELFDFLFSEGYTPQQVLQVPRVLFHSVETIKFRALELKDAGCSPTTLMTLCKSTSQFEKILETAWKRKFKNTG